MNKSSRDVEKYWRRLGQQCISLLHRARDQETRLVILKTAVAYAQMSEHTDAERFSAQLASLPIDFIRELGLTPAF